MAADGSILLVDRGLNLQTAADGVIYRINPTTGARTVVASGGLLENPLSVGVAADGSVLAADRGAGNGFSPGNGLIRLTPGGARNVISGNINDGVLITGSGSTGNVVEGNYIGTTSSGIAILANADSGVEINGSAGNTVGGSASGTGNVISGNLQGVKITGSGATGNTIAGNYIGTNAAGTATLGNTNNGVVILNLRPITVGGSSVGARMLLTAALTESALPSARVRETRFKEITSV